jgi:hypothetical protein
VTPNRANGPDQLPELFFWEIPVTRPNPELKPAWTLDRAEKHRLDDALNEGLEQTFPASDPISITQPLQKRDLTLSSVPKRRLARARLQTR